MIKVPDLSIVIVSFNTKELLKKCLASIKGAEVIVVDNASEDGSVEMVNEEWLMVKRKKSSAINHQPLIIKLIANQTNLGFAKANNQGIRRAKVKYILLLNSDAEVKPGALQKLVEFAQNHPQAGVVGARLLNPDGSIQPSVYHFPTIWRAIKEYWLGQGAYEKYAVTASDAVEVEAVTGAAMLIPKKTIEKVGLLDERYFMYFEDLDYCRRLRSAGLKVYYLPQTEIIHHHGESAVKVGSQAYQWLCQSSKIYNGLVKYYLLFLIIWLGQKWQKLFGKN